MIKEKIFMRSFLALPLLLGFFPASAISGHLPHYGDKKCGWERNDQKVMKWELRQSKKDPKLIDRMMCWSSSGCCCGDEGCGHPSPGQGSSCESTGCCYGNGESCAKKSTKRKR